MKALLIVALLLVMDIAIIGAGQAQKAKIRSESADNTKMGRQGLDAENEAEIENFGHTCDTCMWASCPVECWPCSRCVMNAPTENMYQEGRDR